MNYGLQNIVCKHGLEDWYHKFLDFNFIADDECSRS